jgi:hypothetical protein
MGAMRESDWRLIAAGGDAAAVQMFTGAARLFDRLSPTWLEEQRKIVATEAFCWRTP